MIPQVSSNPIIKVDPTMYEMQQQDVTPEVITSEPIRTPVEHAPVPREAYGSAPIRGTISTIPTDTGFIKFAANDNLSREGRPGAGGDRLNERPADNEVELPGVVVKSSPAGKAALFILVAAAVAYVAFK